MSAPLPDPHLAEEDRHLLVRGMAEFNAGLFFECHDTLEEVWSGVRGPSRDFFQGLIQAAVGFYHLGNDNRGGAATMFRRALARLGKYGDRHAGIELQDFRRGVEAWLQRAEGESPLPEGRDALPKLVEAPPVRE